MVSKVEAAADAVRAELRRTGTRTVQVQLLSSPAQPPDQDGSMGRVTVRLQVDAYEEVMTATLQVSTQAWVLLVDLSVPLRCRLLILCEHGKKFDRKTPLPGLAWRRCTPCYGDMMGSKLCSPRFCMTVLGGAS